MYRAPVDILATFETRDPAVFRHSRQVAILATAICRRLQLAPADVVRIRRAALLHDIGKTVIPNRILGKAGPLSEAEFAIVKRHPEAGARLVERLGDPELTRIVLHHHERLDGAGYPAGLKGEEIPLGARIVAVADTFDALTSERPYRAAMAPHEALELLAAVAGTQLDPDVVRAFRRTQPTTGAPPGPGELPAPAQAPLTRRGPSTARPIRSASG
jgi:putative nucleotidyltransferase with HDIG domain